MQTYFSLPNSILHAKDLKVIGEKIKCFSTCFKIKSMSQIREAIIYFSLAFREINILIKGRKGVRITEEGLEKGNICTCKD